MITINNLKFADIGYYINLDTRVDRKDNIEEQFQKYNIQGFSRYSANRSTSSGPQNCKSSHYEIYRLFLESNDETLFILEDDCLFLPYLYDHTKEIHKEIFSNSFDIFWLGCRNRRWPKHFNSKCYQVQSVSHTQSYIINRKFCQFILDNFPEYGHNGLAIDELLCLAVYGYEVAYDPNKFNFYNLDNPINHLSTIFLALCYERALTTQYASYSDLIHAHADYADYLTSSFPVS